MIDFARTMARLPDEELLRIAHPAVGEDYAAEAIAAAQAETATRGIAADVLPEIPAERTKQMRADAPLSHVGWIAMVAIAPILIFSISFIVILAATGHRQKARDAIGALVAAALIYLVLTLGIVVWVLFLG